MTAVKGSDETKHVIELLRNSVLMSKCTDDQLKKVASRMKRVNYKRDQLLMREGDIQDRMFVISEGEVVREKVVDGKLHDVNTYMGGLTVGSLHILKQDPCYATTRCVSDVTAYELESSEFLKIFHNDSAFAYNVAHSLTLQIRQHTNSLRTPLFEQHAYQTPFLAVSIAASIESFYRAALNSVLNQQLTGVKMGALFPNMHIQVPTRVMYINGFKGLRQYFDSTVLPYLQQLYPSQYEANPQYFRLSLAIAPGILMTPISSILEASNAGHSNPEPMIKRWYRGLVPRMAREVIFGIGLNQLSDYCEERVPAIVANPTLRNAGGSLTAGVVCGYLSHVVHNMSVLKLMAPQKTYGQLWADYVKKSDTRLPAGTTSKLIRYGAALFTPVGFHIRTGQIVGSFIILNGTIKALSGLEIKWRSSS